MKFVYKPEGANPQEWEFDPNRLMSPEVEAIERNTGLAFGEWIDQVGKGSFRAIHGLLYVLLKRQHPTLKWDEVQFCMEDISFEMSPEEKAATLKDLERKRAAGTLTDSEAEVLQELREEGVDESEANVPLETTSD